MEEIQELKEILKLIGSINIHNAKQFEKTYQKQLNEAYSRLFDLIKKLEKNK